MNTPIRENETSSSDVNVQDGQDKLDDASGELNSNKIHTELSDDWNEESTADSNENEANTSLNNTMVICFNDLESLMKLKEELEKRHINLDSISMVSSDPKALNIPNQKYALEFKDEINMYRWF